MSTQDNLNSNTLADASQLNAADGGGAVDSTTLTLAEMNSFLGTDFKDKGSALSSMKETRNFVGKRVTDIEAQVRAQLGTSSQAPAPAPDTSNMVSKSEFKSLQDQLFYTQNPQYKEYADVITSMGQNPAEVVESPAFKKVYAKVIVADEAEGKRSIVSSSPRLAVNKTVIESAVQHANALGSSTQSTAELLASNILNEISGS